MECGIGSPVWRRGKTLSGVGSVGSLDRDTRVLIVGVYTVCYYRAEGRSEEDLDIVLSKLKVSASQIMWEQSLSLV